MRSQGGTPQAIQPSRAEFIAWYLRRGMAMRSSIFWYCRTWVLIHAWLSIIKLAQSAGATLTAFLQRVNTPHECLEYDSKQSDGEVPVMLELWQMWSTSSLPLLPGPLWPRMVAPDRVLSMSQIELNCVLMLNWIVWNRTVYMYKNGFIKHPCLDEQSI